MLHALIWFKTVSFVLLAFTSFDYLFSESQSTCVVCKEATLIQVVSDSEDGKPLNQLLDGEMSESMQESNISDVQDSEGIVEDLMDQDENQKQLDSSSDQLEDTGEAKGVLELSDEDMDYLAEYIDDLEELEDVELSISDKIELAMVLLSIKKDQYVEVLKDHISYYKFRYLLALTCSSVVLGGVAGYLFCRYRNQQTNVI